MFERGGTNVINYVQGLKATLQGMTTWTKGRLGVGINFPGSASAYVLVKNGITVCNLARWSISIWFRSPNNPAISQPLYCERASSGNDILKLQQLGSGDGAAGKLQLVLRDDAGTLDFINGGNVVNDGKLHNYVLTRSGNAIRGYLDGKLDISATANASSTMTNSVETRLGADAGDGGVHFSGHEYLLQVWRRTLTQREVNQLYADPFRIYRKPISQLGKASTPPVTTRFNIMGTVGM
jgi:hypothetical protein